MGARVRGVAVVAVVLAVGAYLGSAVQQWWATPTGVGGREAPSWDGERVRVEVLNAGGRSGMAREATDRLRGEGFDVVYWGNAGAFGSEGSMVVDRAGRVEAARSVARALGIESVRSEPDTTLLLDVSVVLGQDWEPEAEEAEAPQPPWWDVRRFFRSEEPVPAGRMADPGRSGEGN